MRAGGQPGGADGSMTKLMWGRIDQRSQRWPSTCSGRRRSSGRWAWNLASSRQATIAGGTTEINLNIVAEHGLGLPREPNAH